MYLKHVSFGGIFIYLLWPKGKAVQPEKWRSCQNLTAMAARQDASWSSVSEPGDEVLSSPKGDYVNQGLCDSDVAHETVMCPERGIKGDCIKDSMTGLAAWELPCLRHMQLGDSGKDLGFCSPSCVGSHISLSTETISSSIKWDFTQW